MLLNRYGLQVFSHLADVTELQHRVDVEGVLVQDLLFGRKEDTV